MEKAHSDSKAGSSKAAGAFMVLLCSFVFFSTFSIAGTQTSLTLAVLLWAFLMITGRIPLPRSTRLDIPVIVFVAASLVIVIFSQRRLQSFESLKHLLLLSIIYVFAFPGGIAEQRRKIFSVLLLSGAASALYGIILFFMGRGEDALGRISGSFSNPMTFGGVMFLLSSLFFSVGIGRGLSLKIRGAVLSASLLTAAALFFSFTRSSWLGMLASSLIIILILRRRWLVPFVAALFVFYLLLPAPYQNRIKSIWDLEHRTNIRRLQLLDGGWRIFKEHPVIGVGQGDLAEIYRRHKSPEADRVYGHLHNIFLQAAVTGGIVGLFAFCFLIYSFFRLLVSNLRIDLPPPERAWIAGSVGALTGFVVNGLFECNFGDDEVVMLLYFIIGTNLAMALNAGRFPGRGSAPEES